MRENLWFLFGNVKLSRLQTKHTSAFDGYAVVENYKAKPSKRRCATCFRSSLLPVKRYTIPEAERSAWSAVAEMPVSTRMPEFIARPNRSESRQKKQSSNPGSPRGPYLSTSQVGCFGALPGNITIHETLDSVEQDIEEEALASRDHKQARIPHVANKLIHE